MGYFLPLWYEIFLWRPPNHLTFYVFLKQHMHPFRDLFLSNSLENFPE